MKKYLILFTGIIIPLIVSSQDYDTNFIDNRLYDYLFESGSFWVYEKADSTNVIDSLVETAFVHECTPPVIIHGELVMGPVEYYKVFYESKTLNYQTWDQYIGYVIVREGLDWGNNGQYIFLSSYEIGDNTGGAEIIDTMDTLVLNDFEFYHVTRMLIMHDIFENNNPVSYYYAKGIGMIRKEIYSGDTTNLQVVWNIKNWQVDYILDIKQEFEKVKKLTAFPNPAKNYMHLCLAQDDLPGNLIIYNLKGNIVYENRAVEKEIDLDLGKLIKGIYILNFENDSVRKSLKIIKN